MAKHRESTIDRFKPLSSENKETGWKNFERFIPLFLEKNLPSTRELPLIHRLVTRGAATDPVPVMMLFEAAARLTTDNHPHIKTDDQRTAIARKVLDNYRTKPELLRQKEQVLKIRQTDSAEPSHTRFRVFLPRQGHYRQFGYRQIDDGPKEIIEAPHDKPFYTNTPTGVKEEFYLGLAYRMRPLFETLCDQLDVHLEQAATLEDKLAAMIHFQLWGATVIHPFPDGNGRAFGAKFILDLHKIGLPLQRMPGLPEVHPDVRENFMAVFGTNFLLEFTAQEKIPLLTQREAAAVVQSQAKYQAYMRRLYDAISVNMQRYPGTDRQKMYIQAGVDMLKLCLSREGLIPRSYYDANIGQLIASARTHQP